MGREQDADISRYADDVNMFYADQVQTLLEIRIKKARSMRFDKDNVKVVRPDRVKHQASAFAVADGI